MGTDELDLSKKAVIIMCADNGIVEEGVSQSGQEVTAAVAQQMGKGASSVGKMAAAIGADTIPIDIGINRKEEIAGVLNRKVRCGARNFTKEPAMTREEALRAVFIGMEIVEDCKRKGCRILATGEMGIGNTTTSSAVAAALLRCKAEEVTGRGAGLCDEKLQNKKRIIERAIKKYGLYEADRYHTGNSRRIGYCRACGGLHRRGRFPYAGCAGRRYQHDGGAACRENRAGHGTVFDSVT